MRGRIGEGARALAVALVLAFACGARPASAATTNAFPAPSGGPRVAALGGHIVALVRDDYALETNPGRLVYAGRVASAQFDRLDPDLELMRGRVGVAMATGAELEDAFRTVRPRAAAFGASVDALSLTLIGGSAYREATLTGGGAIALTNFAALGVAARYQRAQTDVPGAEATGFGVDFGLAVNVSDTWDAGLAIRDAFGRATYETSDDEDRPARLTIGAGTTRKRWLAEADYTFQYDKNAALSAGVEVHVVPGTLDLRGGASRETIRPARTILTAGAGFTFSAFHLDYAFGHDADGPFDQQHRVALSARF
jgi:hypothetical protein